MSEKMSYINLIEAPKGYGKTYFIDNNFIDDNYQKINYIHQNDNFINCLIMSFQLKNISCPISDNWLDWYKFFNKSKESFVLTIDDLELIKDSKIYDFIGFFIKNKSKNIHFVFAISEKISIDTKTFLNKDFKLIQKEDLVFNQKTIKRLWKDNNLELNKNDLEFLSLSKGWPQAISLYLDFRKKKLSKEKFDYLLKESVLAIFSDLRTNNIFSEKLNKSLEKKFLEKDNWSELIFDTLAEINKNTSDYWIYLANQSKEINQSILYLKRAVNICLAEKEFNQLVYIYNRLIYFYSNESDYQQLDITLQSIEKYIDMVNDLNKTVYFYLKANRMRQKSLYQKALEDIEKVLMINSSDINILKFQTKSYVLKGLIYYQIGEYDKTRDCYQRAIYLSKAERNFVLETEITIMLAFLNVWEGKNIDILPENIIEIIDNFKIKDQPLMWLNLSFYWILGEKISIDNVELILEKIKKINEKLKYNFLIPLIADVEARMLRFKGEYEKALYHHKISLNNLQHDSFEFIHAKLNMALTLIKIDKNEEAKLLFKEVYDFALKTKAMGLKKEAETILRLMDSSLIEEKNNVLKFNSMINQNPIQINFFGGFEIKVDHNETIKWSRKKSKNLIVYLLLSPRGIHRETLAEMLFSEDMQPLKNLDVHIHFIRKIFDNSKDREESIIIFKNSCYFLNRRYDYIFDVESFDSNYAKWSKTTDQKLKILLAQQIILIYKGEFLPEVDFADDWLSERESYRKRTVEVIKDVISKEKDNYELYEKLISIDPLDEENYITYMNESYKNKALVKNIYKRYLNIMEKELLLKPDKKIELLYKELLAKNQ